MVGRNRATQWDITFYTGKNSKRVFLWISDSMLLINKSFYCSISNFTFPTELSMSMVTNRWKTRPLCQTQHSLKYHILLAWLSSPTNGLHKSTNNQQIRWALNRACHQSLKGMKSGGSYRRVYTPTYPFPQHNHSRSLPKKTHKSHFQMTWHIQKWIFRSDGTTFLSASGPRKRWWFSIIWESDFGGRRTWM